MADHKSPSGNAGDGRNVSVDAAVEDGLDPAAGKELDRRGAEND